MDDLDFRDKGRREGRRAASLLMRGKEGGARALSPIRNDYVIDTLLLRTLRSAWIWSTRLYGQHSALQVCGQLDWTKP